MINLKEERLKWQHDRNGIDKYVDALVLMLDRDAQADLTATMAVDMMFRQFLLWLHSAQAFKADSELARNSIVHLMNIMILELSQRMKSQVDGKNVSKLEWCDEFLADIREELVEDLANIAARPPQAPVRG